MQEISTIPSTKNADTTSPKTWNQFKDQISLLQSLLAFMVGLSFLVSLSGYIVFTTHLYEYTDIPHLSVKPIYYLVSGFIIFMILNCLIITLWFNTKLMQAVKWVSKKIRNKIIRALFIIILFILGLDVIGHIGLHAFLLMLVLYGTFSFIFVLLSWQNKSVNKEIIDTDKILPTQENLLNLFKESPFNIITPLLIILSFIMFQFISRSAGVPIYRMFSSDMGGGHPTTSAIIFNDATQLQRLGLSRVSDTKTATLCFLAELEGGYLVYEPSTQQALSIPNQAIAAIIDDGSYIDCSPPNRSLNPQSAPLITPEATPDIQPTLTP